MPLYRLTHEQADHIAWLLRTVEDERGADIRAALAEPVVPTAAEATLRRELAAAEVALGRLREIELSGATGACLETLLVLRSMLG